MGRDPPQSHWHVTASVHGSQVSDQALLGPLDEPATAARWDSGAHWIKIAKGIPRKFHVHIPLYFHTSSDTPTNYYGCTNKYIHIAYSCIMDGALRSNTNPC
jgi:hypothetical protein